MKRFTALLLSLLLLLPLLVSCGSPYDHPEKYVTLPPLSEINVKNENVENTLQDVMDELLENLTGEHFTPISNQNETILLGDKVYISYTGEVKDSSVVLSEAAKNALTATEEEYVFIVPGTGMLPDGVENALVGAKAGDELSVTVTYTEEDTDITELIGQEVTLFIKVLRLSRLSITERHAVKLQYTAALADGSEPTEELAALLKGNVETTDLADKEDTFCEVFSSGELLPHVLGCRKLQEIRFTLTLDAECAADFGYDHAIDIAFEATVKEASETPTALTDVIIQDLTYGEYTTVEDYEAFCRNMVKEDLALRAISDAAEFAEEFPQELYDEFYTENYNEALYEIIGYNGDYTIDQLAGMLSAEVLAQVEEAAYEGTISELRERFLLEYLYDLLNLTLSDEEYQEALNDLYQTYQINYSYMLLYYNITSATALEGLLGKDYLEVQFLYEKLLPLLKEEVNYID